VQNKKQISAKKAENLHLVGQIVPKKPLNIEFKGFFRFRWTTSERILVGWRQLNKFAK